MKKLLIILFCLSVLLMSCTGNQDTSSFTSSDTNEVVSEVSSVSSSISNENSETTSSKEEVFEFAVDAKTAVERISSEISLTADIIEIDERFLYEKTSIASDMYDDFYGTMSYEIADNSFVMVFCCNTAVRTTNLKEHIENAISSDSISSLFDSDTKVISYYGYTIVISTKSNFDEENLISKLIQ